MSMEIRVVVQVYRGIPVLVEAFRDAVTAQKRANALKSEINPEDDEVAVFEVTVK